MLPDYVLNADLVMMSPTAIIESMYEVKPIPKPIIPSDGTKPDFDNTRIRFELDKEFFERKNVQMCIQNDDKFISFMRGIKASNADAVMFVQDNYLMCMNKAAGVHPILVMRFPLDGTNVYARDNRLRYIMPIGDVFGKSSQTTTSYAVYYRIKTKPGTAEQETYVCFRAPDANGEIMKKTIKVTMSCSESYIDSLLSMYHVDNANPADISDVITLTSSTTNLDKLKNITLTMLTPVSTSTQFNAYNYTKTERKIIFETGPTELKFHKYESSGSKSVERIATASTSKLWNFTETKEYTMLPRNLLLLQTASKKIKSSSGSLYFAFGRFGDKWVFIKIVVSRPIEIPDPTLPFIKLDDITAGRSSVFELYFCE